SSYIDLLANEFGQGSQIFRTLNVLEDRLRAAQVASFLENQLFDLLKRHLFDRNFFARVEMRRFGAHDVPSHKKMDEPLYFGVRLPDLHKPPIFELIAGLLEHFTLSGRNDILGLVNP